MIVIYGTHVENDNISRPFFQFFNILNFWVVRDVTGQEKVPTDKNFCQPCSVSQEPYIMWFSFMVHMCEVIISPGCFFIFFKILIFQVFRGVKVKKMVQNGKKSCLTWSISQDPYIIWFSFTLHLCKMIISSVSFSIFFKILI